MLALRENARLLRAQRASEDRLRHEVTHDGLTGLGNRGLFRTRVTEALRQRDTTVLLVDLDDFKTVNDSLGHDVGDQLLIAVAAAPTTIVTTPSDQPSCRDRPWWRTSQGITPSEERTISAIDTP